MSEPQEEKTDPQVPKLRLDLRQEIERIWKVISDLTDRVAELEDALKRTEQ